MVGTSIECLISQLITEDEIKERAKELWAARGCREGHDKEDWAEAERQLKKEKLEALLDQLTSGSHGQTPSVETRPRVFVGSSREGLEIAKTIQLLLDPSCEVRIWAQGVFRPGTTALDALVEQLESCDFAILVLTPDDLLETRGQWTLSPRDNVILELGMFLDRLGPQRTFIVYDRSPPVRMPSDLVGITAVPYQPPADDNWEPALGPPCTKIEHAIKKLGIRT